MRSRCAAAATEDDAADDQAKMLMLEKLEKKSILFSHSCTNRRHKRVISCVCVCYWRHPKNKNGNGKTLHFLQMEVMTFVSFLCLTV